MEDRWRVVHCIQSGMTYTDIQRTHGYTPAFISRWWKRYQETGSVEDAPRSGRPKTLTADQRTAIVRSLKRKATGSLRRTAKKFKAEHGIEVSHVTIRNVAVEEGLCYRRRPQKPLLQDRHKTARLRFANRRYAKGFFDRVMWSDEASFALYSDTKGQWVAANEEAAPRETVKWPPRIRVWAAISSKGKTPLVRIPKKMTAAEFADLLSTKLIPLMSDVFDGDRSAFVLMQDGDGCHTAKIVRNRLKIEGVEDLWPWPAHSPDLNPIENAWAIVERHLQMANPRTAAGLWEAMQRAWDSIDDATLRRLCGSLPRRLAAVREARGGHTKY